MEQRFPRLLLLTLLTASVRPAASDDWVEVRSPHFWVVSNDGEKHAVEVAREFEEIREVFRTGFVLFEQDPRLPILIVAVKDEKSLSEILPQYWEREGPKPAGVFFRGIDKHFVALNLDAKREQRYQTIYHEYFHLLLNLNLRRMPVWLNEGLAELWERTDIRKDHVVMGTPNANHLRFFTRESMMPLQTLLAMEGNPHTSDPNRVSVFYAQSWALTHMILLGDAGGQGRQGLTRYLDLLDDGVDSVAAFEQVFGAIFVVDTNLRRYVTRPRLNAMRMDISIRADEKTFSRKELSRAQALAIRGNFLISGSRPDSGLPLLERALSLDPDLTIALESMGLYHYRNDNREEASEWFARAARADSGSYLSHYYRARLAEFKGDDGIEELRQALRQTIELNPDFAAAHAELGRHYAMTGVRLESAYALARKAVELDPDNAWYWVNLGRILLMMEKPEQARVASQEAAALTRDEAADTMVSRLIADIVRYERRAGAEPGATPRVERRQAAGDPVESGRFSRSTLRAGDSQIQGVFEELRCNGGSSVEFIVSSEGKTYVLYTDDPGSIQLLVNGESVSRDMNCGSQGDRVTATFTPDGVDASTELRGKILRLEFLGTSPDSR